MICPGEIYLADIPQTGFRPVVVISREELNRGDYVVAILITSARFKLRSRLPNCVPFEAGQFGLTKKCVAQAETVSALPIDCIDLSQGPVGMLDHDAMRAIVRAMGAMGHIMAASCEPD